MTVGAVLIASLALAAAGQNQRCRVDRQQVSIDTRTDRSDPMSEQECTVVSANGRPLFHLCRTMSCEMMHRVLEVCPPPGQFVCDGVSRPLRPIRYTCRPHGVEIAPPGGAAVEIELPSSSDGGIQLSASMMKELADNADPLFASPEKLKRTEAIRATLDLIVPEGTDDDASPEADPLRPARTQVVLTQASLQIALEEWTSADESLQLLDGSAAHDPALRDQVAALTSSLEKARAASRPLSLGPPRTFTLAGDPLQLEWAGEKLCVLYGPGQVSSVQCLNLDSGAWTPQTCDVALEWARDRMNAVPWGRPDRHEHELWLAFEPGSGRALVIRAGRLGFLGASCRMHEASPAELERLAHELHRAITIGEGRYTLANEALVQIHDPEKSWPLGPPPHDARVMGSRLDPPDETISPSGRWLAFRRDDKLIIIENLDAPRPREPGPRGHSEPDAGAASSAPRTTSRHSGSETPLQPTRPSTPAHP